MSQAQLLPSDHSSPSVTLHKGRPATTSLEVAKFFGKRHDNVVRDIKQIMDNCPKEFNALNFEGVDYADEKGELRPMFILHRDGFMLLVMGYTGKKAMQIKIAYIQAFNAMEEQLQGRAALQGDQPQAPPRPYCTDREMKPLDTAVDAWVKSSKLTRLEALAKLRTQFGITRYNRFWPVELIQPAIAWIHAQSGTLKALPNTKQLFDDIRKAEHALKPVENWTHIAVRGELGRAADSIARQAVDMHVNAAWYALGLARSALLSALAVGKIMQ